ncbi:MAG: NAD(P)-dependent oxidoreductase [Candidatus Omnitrophota bacterium]
MNILVLGGSGFIGRNLVDYFKEEYQISAPTHEELELLDEGAVKSYFDSHKFDVVIHCAVRPGHRNAKDSSNQLYNNLRMFFNIARNSGKFGKLIFLSSGAVYDVTRSLVKVKEEDFDTVIPSDEHGFSKYIIAKYIEKMSNAVELRIFGIFGKYEDYAIRFISNAICKALFNLPITIRQSRKLSYFLVDDLMPVINYFINNNPRYRVYNVTPDEPIKISDLANMVKKNSGKNVPIIINGKTMGVEYSGDNSRLRGEITDLSITPIDVAIEKLYKWYAENSSLINKQLLLIDK